MGTTLDLVLIVANTAFLAHIGDGRIYLRQGEAHQLTEDHTLVAQQLRSGSLTPEEARRLGPEHGDPRLRDSPLHDDGSLGGRSAAPRR